MKLFIVLKRGLRFAISQRTGMNQHKVGGPRFVQEGTSNGRSRAYLGTLTASMLPA
jgi:hypothetical protein